MDQQQRQSEPRNPFSGEPSQQALPLQEQKTDHTSSPEMDSVEGMSLSTPMDQSLGNSHNSGPGLGLGGVGGVQQPKVQTAFIHKLYKY